MSISDRLDSIAARAVVTIRRARQWRERITTHYEGGLVSADLAIINGAAIRLSEGDDQ